MPHPVTACVFRIGCIFEELRFVEQTKVRNSELGYANAFKLYRFRRDLVTISKILEDEICFLTEDPQLYFMLPPKSRLRFPALKLSEKKSYLQSTNLIHQQMAICYIQSFSFSTYSN